jgi:hypothetical protein
MNSRLRAGQASQDWRRASDSGRVNSFGAHIGKTTARWLYGYKQA